MECNKCDRKIPDCNGDRTNNTNRSMNCNMGRGMNYGMNRGANSSMNRNMNCSMNRSANNMNRNMNCDMNRGMNRNMSCNMNRNSKNSMNRNNERRREDESCCEIKNTMNEGCDRGNEPVDKMKPGMSFVPWQEWRDVYCMEEGLENGTIFGELNKPYIGRSMK